MTTTTDLRAALREAIHALTEYTSGVRTDATIADLRAIADAPPTVAELLPMVDATHEVRWTDADGDEWRAVEADVDGGPRIAIEMRGSDQAGVWWFGHYPLASDLAAPARLVEVSP